ncbi:resuscitation-promoting factor, partial [Streptomyces sp. NPDC057540]
MSTSQGSHRAGRRGAAATLPVHEQPTQAAPLVLPPVTEVSLPGQGTRAGARRAARRRRAAGAGSAAEGLRRL